MGTEEKPEISVIVPVRDGAETLPPLLASLRAQTLSPERYEVIVVDNASTDGTAEVAGRAGARVVAEPVANRSRARNRGVRAARTRLYAFTDADCVAAPTWLESLLKAKDVAPLVAGKVEVGLSARPNAIERFEALWRFNQGAWVTEGWAATANLLVHAKAFEAIGGFDSAWRHIAEDADFCLRAGRAGFPLGYTADAVVSHDAESHLRPYLRRCFLHGYSSNQAHYRLGVGHRAWREPWPLVSGRLALGLVGQQADAFDPRERRRMSAVAQLGYAGRVAGSAWAEAVRAR